MAHPVGRKKSRFLSTLSLRRATTCCACYSPALPISIHALLAESDIDEIQLEFNSLISIHALLAESDVSMRIDTDNNFDFYPRSPCGERPFIQIKDTPKTNFYPRSPCGERPVTTLGGSTVRDFYPRSPCGERLPVQAREDP